MKVFLVGYMGVGKTTIGKKLGRLLHLNFIDLDHYIEQKEQTSISQIIDSHGEIYFRNLEKQSIDELASCKEVVISAGGGAPCYNNLMEVLKKQGVVVWLKMPESAMVNRLKASEGRPLLARKSLQELTKFVHKHYRGRLDVYEQSHIHFDALSVNAAKLKELSIQIQNYSM